MKTNLFRSGIPVMHAAAVLALSSLIFASCIKEDNNYTQQPAAQATVLGAAGDSASIIGTINQFRALLGEPLNTTPGQTAGRREVNWDGVPPAFTNNNLFPFDFFNSTLAIDPAGRKRGLVMSSTSGPSFRVDSTNLVSVDASYANQFETFSRKRVFVFADNTSSEAGFKVPGTATNASIKGFGAIFSDVDIAGSATLEFFDGTTSLGVFQVPVRNIKGSFSFLGVFFPDAKATRVKITSGNGVVGTGVKDISDGGSKDLVIMDDFFYNEPVAN